MSRCHLDKALNPEIIEVLVRTNNLAPKSMNYSQAADVLVKEFPNLAHHTPVLDQWYNGDLNDPRALLDIPGMTMLRAVERYLIAYNDIFFCGQVPLQKCPVEIISTKDTRWVSGSAGHSVDQRDIDGLGSPATIASPIKIMERVENTRSLTTNLKSYAKVGLSLQIQSYFNIYCCFCDDCSATGDESGMATEGKTGHGFPYFRVASAFEQFAEGQPGMNIDMDLHRDMAWELHSNGYLDPRSFRMRTYGLLRPKVNAIFKNMIDANAYPYYDPSEPSSDEEDDESEDDDVEMETDPRSDEAFDADSASEYSADLSESGYGSP